MVLYRRTGVLSGVVSESRVDGQVMGQTGSAAIDTSTVLLQVTLATSQGSQRSCVAPTGHIGDVRSLDSPTTSLPARLRHRSPEPPADWQTEAAFRGRAVSGQSRTSLGWRCGYMLPRCLIRLPAAQPLRLERQPRMTPRVTALEGGSPLAYWFASSSCRICGAMIVRLALNSYTAMIPCDTHTPVAHQPSPAP